MTTSNYNIKQITGYDLKNAPEIYYTITVPHRKETPNAEGKYEIEFINEIVLYKTAIEGTKIFKLGYCCDPKSIIYPIFLQMNNSYTKIQVGRDGMYEMQPETWKNINDFQETEEQESDVKVTGVRVPASAIFTLDYVIEEN